MATKATGETERADYALIGAGIMSSTLAVLLKELDPDARVVILETLEEPALESSNAWNNAGTGHAALCELNYTPELQDGSVEISKALEVNGEFDLSRGFWTTLVKQGALASPGDFIHPVPHMSFVRGAEAASFLGRRYAALSAHHCYRGMEYTEDRAKLGDWAPLVMEGRDPSEIVAATRLVCGTDVDYGALTRLLLRHATSGGSVSLEVSSRVTGITRDRDAGWRLRVHDETSGAEREVVAPFVFIGAGGGALPLLQKAKLPEADGFAGFPVSGLWLRSDNAALAERHDAKVYGKAATGAPPMSVPHLDKRLIEGKPALLFGPYAGVTTKFTKHGSLLDLWKSIRLENIRPMLDVGAENFDLTLYLAGQVVQSEAHRFAVLREFFPRANPEDWVLMEAGQRVQIIERDRHRGGVLRFGTELVGDTEGTLVALLGASPGASTAVAIMVKLLERCFSAKLDAGWRAKLRELIPSYGQPLSEDAALCRRVRSETAAALGLRDVE